MRRRWDSRRGEGIPTIENLMLTVEPWLLRNRNDRWIILSNDVSCEGLRDWGAFIFVVPSLSPFSGCISFTPSEMRAERGK